MGESNPHPGVRLGVDHLAECGNACAAVRNSQRNSGAFCEWTGRGHIAAEQAQVGGACGEEPFRLQIGQFNAGCERITAGAVESRLNGTASLLRFYATRTTRPKKNTRGHRDERISLQGEVRTLPLIERIGRRIPGECRSSSARRFLRLRSKLCPTLLGGF